MKGRLFLIMVLVSYSLPWRCFGEADPDSEKDLAAYKKYQQDNFRDFPTTGPGVQGRGGSGGSYKGNNPYKQVNNFPEGDSRNYVKKAVMDKISTLAQGLATTAGSALAFDNALQLRNQATQLNATGDPTFSKMATLLKQEATAIEKGDKTTATNLANQIADMPRPYVAPSYQPGPQENQFAAALGAILGTIVEGALAVLGTTLTGKLLLALGLGSGGSLSSAVGNGVGNLGGAVVAGQNTNSTATNASLGVVNAAGSDTNTTVQREIRTNVNDGSSGGGAPKATNQ